MAAAAAASTMPDGDDASDESIALLASAAAAAYTCSRARFLRSSATHLSASMAGLVWAGLEWRRFGRPSMVGMVTGVVAGLATVTPASGYVGPLGGLILGVCGSVVCFFAVDVVKHRFRIDDSLDVFAVHGVGVILGTILVAGLAQPAIGGAGYPVTGGPLGQLWVQLAGIAAVIAWSGIVSIGLVWITRRLVGLRARDEEIDDGLDLTYHGERAFNP